MQDNERSYEGSIEIKAGSFRTDSSLGDSRRNKRAAPAHLLGILCTLWPDNIHYLCILTLKSTDMIRYLGIKQFSILLVFSHGFIVGRRFREFFEEVWIGVEMSGPFYVIQESIRKDEWMLDARMGGIPSTQPDQRHFTYSSAKVNTQSTPSLSHS